MSFVLPLNYFILTQYDTFHVWHIVSIAYQVIYCMLSEQVLTEVESHHTVH